MNQDIRLAQLSTTFNAVIDLYASMPRIKHDQLLHGAFWSFLASVIGRENVSRELHIEAIHVSQDEITRRMNDINNLLRSTVIGSGLELTSEMIDGILFGMHVHQSLTNNPRPEIVNQFILSCRQVVNSSNKILAFDLVLQKLAGMLGLEDDERHLFRAMVAVSSYPPLAIFLSIFHHNGINREDTAINFAAAVIQETTQTHDPMVMSRLSYNSYSETAFRIVLSPTKTKLYKFGLMSSNSRFPWYFRLDKTWASLLAANSQISDVDDTDAAVAKLMNDILVPLTPAKKIEGARGRLKNPDDEEIFTSMIDSELGMSALVYGPKSINKLNWLYEQKLSYMSGFVFAPPKDAETNTNHGLMVIARKCLENDIKKRGLDVSDVLFVVAKAERVLSSRSNRYSWFSDDPDLYDSITSKDDEDETDIIDELVNPEGFKQVFVTNHPSSLNDETLLKFKYHFELFWGTRKDRLEEISIVADEVGLTNEQRELISRYKKLSSEQIRTAVELSSVLAINPPMTRFDVFKNSIDRSQIALSRTDKEGFRVSPTSYDLANLNLSSKYTPEKIISALDRLGHGSLAMYGVPGTGKTMFAEYIAKTLDKPLLKKRASDLLSKWVGEAEKNIKAAFDEAREEGSILFIDEADSFLRERSLARNSWEVTQVNELLQQMEEFDGIFICATNLMKAVDAAALRRFTFKLEFKPLTSQQRWEMFMREVGVDENTTSIDELLKYRAGLDVLKLLTPGDFAVIKRQEMLFNEKLPPSRWLDELHSEVSMKAKSIEENESYASERFVEPRK